MEDTTAQRMKLKEKKKEATQKIEQLKTQINELASARYNGSAFAADGQTLGNRMRRRRTLVGHFGKVVSISWHADAVRAMTSSQDGNVIVWDCQKACKKHLVPLRSAWVMFAEVLKSEGQEYFISGGLDNVMTLWKCPSVVGPHAFVREFHGHDGYVSSGRFLDEGTALTISGDQTVALWKLQGKSHPGQDGDERASIFKGHEKDVTSIDLKPGGEPEFATSSADGSVIIWNVNEKGPLSTMRLHIPQGYQGPQDVNKVKYQSNGFGLGLSTEQMGCLLFDSRTRSAINKFDPSDMQKKNTSKYSCAFSKSGRLLFAASEDWTVEVWDTTIPDAKRPIKCFGEFQNRVTDVAVNESGTACAAVSWDSSGGIFAP